MPWVHLLAYRFLVASGRPERSPSVAPADTRVLVQNEVQARSSGESILETLESILGVLLAGCLCITCGQVKSDAQRHPFFSQKSV